MSIQDISEALGEWDYEPGTITVRKIIGEDGREKVQMRVEMGLLQMEMTGRPDGQRPNGKESYLEALTAKRDAHVRRYGDDDNFELSTEECSELREESLHYYYRYLSLFHLEDFDQVILDTQRNIEASQLLRDYAESDEDRYSIEQYRPYILMMNTQAKARSAAADGRHYDALGEVRTGMRLIGKFLDENFEIFGIAKDCPEMSILTSLEQEMLLGLPEDSVERLRDELKAAIASEEFEKAASLRDRIRSLGE